DANDPAAAAQFHGSPPAQAFMQQYLAAPRDQRIQMAAQMQQLPGASQFVGTVAMMAQECSKY
ncbi:MAG: hemophore-related protein, partial [Actinomycetota bacterium]|nr:hemophore-related protein [Actinomycetota bacterium]